MTYRFLILAFNLSMICLFVTPCECKEVSYNPPVGISHEDVDAGISQKDVDTAANYVSDTDVTKKSSDAPNRADSSDRAINYVKSDVVFFPSEENPIAVRKYGEPAEGNSYLTNHTISIFLEIRGSASLLRIKEKLDPKLELIKLYPPVLYNPFNETERKVFRKTSDTKNISQSTLNYSWRPNSKEFYINIGKLTRGYRLEYKYEVIPKKSGCLRPITIIRYGSSSDNDYPLEIPVLDFQPKFVIDADIDKEEVSKGEKLDVEYEISCANADSCPLNACISMENGDNNTYWLYDESGSLLSNASWNACFSSNSPHWSKKLKIEFRDENKFRLPSIKIDGEKFTSPEQAVSVKWSIGRIFEKYAISATIVLALLGLILNGLALIYTTRLQAKAERRSLDVFSNHMGDHLDQIAKSSNLIQLELRKLRESFSSRNQEDSDIYPEISRDD